jgi:hypothetical protein
MKFSKDAQMQRHHSSKHLALEVIDLHLLPSYLAIPIPVQKIRATPQVLLSPNHENLQSPKESQAPKQSVYLTTAIDSPAKKETPNLLKWLVNGDILKLPILHLEFLSPFQEPRRGISWDLNLRNLAQMVIGKPKAI